uniref:Uncharacterized protein n=1 Tax=Rhizophora mucronata TaxID=61149 RepID=A0A2P2PBK4_RHIMU
MLRFPVAKVEFRSSESSKKKTTK